MKETLIKYTLIKYIEHFGMDLKDFFEDSDTEFTFTMCRVEDLVMIKKLLEEVKLEFTEDFEVDGGYPVFMVTVDTGELKNLVS